MKKVKFFFNEDKEEQWINDMCAQGWQFKKFFLNVYTFEKGEPGDYTYRIDYLQNFGFGHEVKEYIEFVESTGAELVQKQFGWAYFRQHQQEGAFHLYSDNFSKLKFINRLFYFYVAIIVMNLVSIMLNSTVGILRDNHSMHDFFIGMGIGCISVLIIPTMLLLNRRTNLKKKATIFEL